MKKQVLRLLVCALASGALLGPAMPAGLSSRIADRSICYPAGTQHFGKDGSYSFRNWNGTWKALGANSVLLTLDGGLKMTVQIKIVGDDVIDTDANGAHEGRFC